jgi:hypothetical protein
MHGFQLPLQTERAGRSEPILIATVQKVCQCLSSCFRDNRPLKPLAREREPYKIYPMREYPSLDMHLRLFEWIGLLQNELGRCLGPDDYIFPRMSRCGKDKVSIYPTTAQSHETTQRQIDTAISRIGETRGRFTTHCFRRGGAQWRFLYAPLHLRWKLDRVRWWGNWAKGEHVSHFCPENFGHRAYLS